MEESRRVFHHFVVQSVLKCCKSGVTEVVK
jgi:hypothetical protein